MASKKGFYPKTLQVPAKKIAGTNPVGSQAVVGGLTPPMVPSKPGVAHGLGPITKPMRQPKLHGEGGVHVAKLKQGHLRTSGHPGAHQLGSPFKGKKVF